MGSYCTLSVDGREIWAIKNHFIPGIDIMFLDEEKFSQPYSEAEAQEIEHDEKIGFRTSLRAARFRLAIRGYSLNAAKREYDNWRASTFSPSEYLENDQVDPRFYRRVNFDRYLKLLKTTCWVGINSDEPTFEEKYVWYCPSNHELAFPSSDPNFALAALLFAGEGDSVEVDLSDMIAGELWEDGPLSSWKDGQLIIMTEGKSDNELLKRAITLLEKDMATTMRFFDYEFRPQAGAGNNVNLLKSLAAAGIMSPIVAVFDNDAAGHAHAAAARALPLPSNFRVCTYPDLPLAKRYPAIGPSGREQVDINGRACSIELYLGRDCLKRNSRFIPVQWTGYDQKSQVYQGELIDKDRVQKAFHDKLSACEANRAKIASFDFDGIRRIINVIEEEASKLFVSK